ncbi:MAG: hypothetical protein COB58_10630 [Thalassobium sp.]|nr:MAG: hypothetical protein COB58_14555 [Thalassobium sp.]PHQ84522.1 MAG: hypothetical protein COB58_10630 [Thalassobium sp.]
MKKVSLFIAMVVASISSHATVFWTVKAEAGVYVTNSGVVAINIGSYVPITPSPIGTAWEPCANGWIYINKKADGSVNDEKYIDRMLSVALAAFKTNSNIRIGIDRDPSGSCYTMQIFDQGN